MQSTSHILLSNNQILSPSLSLQDYRRLYQQSRLNTKKFILMVQKEFIDLTQKHQQEQKKLLNQNLVLKKQIEILKEKYQYKGNVNMNQDNTDDVSHFTVKSKKYGQSQCNSLNNSIKKQNNNNNKSCNKSINLNNSANHNNSINKNSINNFSFRFDQISDIMSINNNRKNVSQYGEFEQQYRQKCKNNIINNNLVSLKNLNNNNNTFANNNNAFVNNKNNKTTIQQSPSLLIQKINSSSQLNQIMNMNISHQQAYRGNHNRGSYRRIQNNKMSNHNKNHYQEQVIVNKLQRSINALKQSNINQLFMKKFNSKDKNNNNKDKDKDKELNNKDSNYQNYQKNFVIQNNIKENKQNKENYKIKQTKQTNKQTKEMHKQTKQTHKQNKQTINTKRNKSLQSNVQNSGKSVHNILRSLRQTIETNINRESNLQATKIINVKL